MRPRLGTRSDVRHAMGVKGRSGRYHDKKGNEIGNAHPHQRIKLDPRQLTRGLQRCLDQWLRIRILFLIFDFFRGLQEE
jgi:hypothetical protein